MGGCSGCSAFPNKSEPDIDEKNFKKHVREKLLPSVYPEEKQIHLSVIEKNYNKLKKQLSKNKDKINDLDHHGYTPLHLAVLLKWNKGIDLLLSSYASPIISSSNGGWTAIQESISTKQFQITHKLIKALSTNFGEYSNQNVSKIYKQLQEKTDFYIEIKLESFAKGLSGFTANYFPKDTLRIWKSKGLIRIDMTLLDYDSDNKQWLRGNITNIFIIKKSGTFDYYHIDHQNKSVDLQPNKAMLNYDNINIDINKKGDSLKKEINKLCKLPVKTRRIEIKRATLKRSKSWIGAEEQEIVNGINCSLFRASDIQFVTKYRNEHIPESKRKHLKNDSSIVSLIMSGDDDNDDTDDIKEEEEEIKIEDDYNPPTITIEKYKKLTFGDEEIRRNAIECKKKFDSDESFIINTTETNISQTSYNLSIKMANTYDITINELLVIFDLIGIKAAHMDNVKRILQLTAYDRTRFPLCIEMPLFLNVVRAKITFQNLKRGPIDRKIFEIPTTYSR